MSLEKNYSHINKIKIAILSIVCMDVKLVLEFVEYRLVMWSYINKDYLSAVKPVAMAKDGEYLY